MVRRNLIGSVRKSKNMFAPPMLFEGRRIITKSCGFVHPSAMASQIPRATYTDKVAFTIALPKISHILTARARQVSQHNQREHLFPDCVLHLPENAIRATSENRMRENALQHMEMMVETTNNTRSKKYQFRANHNHCATRLFRYW
jgi:uncharacterized membrane protein